MSREKQIEEMANDYYEAMLKARETLGSMNEGEPKWYAKELYAKSYRKVPEGAIVLTRAELDALNKYQERFKGQDAEAVIATEVAKEIFAEIETSLMIESFHGGEVYYAIRAEDYLHYKKKYTQGKEEIPPYVRMDAKALPAILNVKYTEEGK